MRSEFEGINYKALVGLIECNKKPSKPQGGDSGKRGEHRPKGNGGNTKGNHNK